MEFGVPFSFLLVLVFMLCAVISPLVAAGLTWALCTKRWRYIGRLAGRVGGTSATMFIVTYLGLHALSAEEMPVQLMSAAVTAGAGFTAGALGACAWIWIRSCNSMAPAD